MTAAKSREKVLDQIGKLKRHEVSARGLGSIQEANAFALRISKLLDIYQLEMEDIELEIDGSATQEEIAREYLYWGDYGMKDTLRRCSWTERLAYVVTQNNGCACMLHPGANTISLVGKPAQRAICAYLLGTLARFASRQSLRAYTKAYAAAPAACKGYRAAWLTGFIAELAHRYAEREQECDSATSVALMRTTRDVEAARKAVEELTGGRSATPLAAAARHREGYAAGEAAAAKVALDANGLAEPTPQKGLPWPLPSSPARPSRRAGLGQ
jgi:hypothetical protein